MLTCYVYSTKIGEISDISKCFENFVSQALGVLTSIYAAELRNYTNEYPIHFEIDDAEGVPIIEQGFIFFRSSGFEVNEIIKYGYNHNSIMVICTDKYNRKHYLVSFKTGHKTKSGYSEVSFKEINERNYISEKKNYKWIFVRKLRSH